jgi:CubicO group peptidase (beta-lactamase class C family)
MFITTQKTQRLYRVALAFVILLTLMAAFPTGRVAISHAQELGSAEAQGQAQDFSQVDATVQSLMSLYDVPGVAVGLIKDGKIIYTKGYGVRNVQTGQPVTENTIFAIGSVSKSFTALDVAEQVDAGKLNLDAPVITYIPDFKLSDPQATRQLTLRHLLSHTSGVPPFDDWYAAPAKDRKQVVDDMASVKLTAPPGKVWQYTNQNFVVAGYALEQVMGQSWEDYTRQHVFEPLGLTSASFDVATMQKAPDYASPHALDVLNGMQPIPFFTNLAPIGPAGSINANVLDMAKYAAFQLGDGTVGGGESTRLVSQQMLDTMHTQQISIGGATGTAGQPSAQASGQQTQTTTVADAPVPTNLGYGLAWITEDYHGYKVVGHNGAIDGFTSYVTLVPSAKDGVVLLTNAEFTNGGNLFVEAARLHLVNWLLGLPSEPNLTDTINKQNGADPAQFKANLQTARTYKAGPSALAALTGDYSSAAGTLTVTMRDGKLYSQFQGQPKAAELVPFKPGGFLVNTFPVAGSVVTFKSDPNGTVTVYQDGVQVAQRLGKGVQAAEYKDTKGRFTDTIPQGLVLSQQGDLAVLQSANPPAAFVLAASDAGIGSLRDNVRSLLTVLDPTFNQQPVDVRDIPPIGGVTWTQFLYQLPGDQVVGVAATQQSGTAYFVMLQARSADLPALTPTFQALLLGFKIAQPAGNRPPASLGMPVTGEPTDPALVMSVIAALALVTGLAIRGATRIYRAAK